MREYAGSIKSGKVVAYFWASWCKPCKQQRPILERCEKHLKDVAFVSVDCTHNVPPLSPDIEITVFPTIAVFNDGQLLTFTRPDIVKRPYVTGLHTSVRDIVKIIRNIYRQNGVMEK